MSKKDLTTSDKSEVDAFLKKVSQTPAPLDRAGRGRLIFAMDATASRDHSWDQAMNIQSEMFSETHALGGLDIQLAYFQGFGDFHHGKWTSQSESLLREMTAVTCLAGETQIEKTLKHATEEARKGKVNALVFIGDACEEDVDRLGKAAGALGILGVPAFIFHEGRDPIAAFAFQQITRLTKGAYCRFDAHSPQVLRDLLKAVAVYASGGRKALESYADKRGGNVLMIADQMRRK